MALATRFQNDVNAATASEAAVVAARSALRTAVEANNEAFANLRRSAGDTVRAIRAFAEVQANPGAVYNLAEISPPKPAAPAPPPARPTGVTVGVDITTGFIELNWKAKNPPGTQGTSYIIKRRTSDNAEFAFVGVSGTKKFVDRTFTRGPDMVQYTIQGHRADSEGPVSDIIMINFGRVGGGGGVVVQNVQNGSIAAADKPKTDAA